MDKNIFAKRLKEIRKKIKLSQPKLGELIGMSRFSIIDYESGKTAPDIDTLAKIAAVLKTSVAYLMGEVDDPTPFFSCGGEVSSQLGEDLKEPVHITQMDDVIFVPVVSNKIVTACCGEGSPYATDVRWEVEDHFPMPASELIGYTWQGAKYTIMTAEGSSMEPFIRDGEKVLFAEGIDLGIGDIGVFSLNGRLLIRGLIKKNGVYVLRAHNWKEYQDLEIDTKTGDFYVIGKVLKVVSARSVPPVL